MKYLSTSLHPTWGCTAFVQCTHSVHATCPLVTYWPFLLSDLLLLHPPACISHLVLSTVSEIHSGSWSVSFMDGGTTVTPSWCLRLFLLSFTNLVWCALKYLGKQRAKMTKLNPQKQPTVKYTSYRYWHFKMQT
jgi:hypothetical protein